MHQVADFMDQGIKIVLEAQKKTSKLKLKQYPYAVQKYFEPYQVLTKDFDSFL